MCNAGYAGNGATCADVDECLTNNGGCDANAACTNAANSADAPTCVCNAGYAGNGATCADVDECLTNNGGCDANAACTNAANSADAPTCVCNAGYEGDGTECAVIPLSSTVFNDYIQADQTPGQFPASHCDTITQHSTCVSTRGCGWLRTIINGGICRQSPAARCLDSGECVCRASDFHGDRAHEQDLEVFVPLSVVSSNIAPRTSRYEGGQDQYQLQTILPEILNESLGNFTSRTDFSQKTLTIQALNEVTIDSLLANAGLSIALKFLQGWGRAPLEMSGTLLDFLGVEVVLDDNQLSVRSGDQTFLVDGEHPFTDGVKDYQCNQLVITVSEIEGLRIHLGARSTLIPSITMATLRIAFEQSDTNRLLTLGDVNAKLWDLRVLGNGTVLDNAEIAEIGKRCGQAGNYPIPDGYPQSNRRYSWGMGGYDIVPNHTTQSYSSGVYNTMRIPEPDVFPPTDQTYQDNLNRMVGFWDRWHEQMLFELDFLPFVDTRALAPAGSLNSYRNFSEPQCANPETCGEPSNYNNPCRYVTDMFQAFNWLPDDFPGEATSADHRKIAQRGGWTRWDTHDPELYGSWQRPVHEHGHAVHFTLMRTYNKVHHYVRGIAGEGFAEIMSGYVLTGLKSWMNNAMTYYPTIPISFEGRWNGERHVFKSNQPYQQNNIDDMGLGARFYGLSVWWTYVSHFAGKPYIVGRIAADNDETPGSPIQKMRFYLAQEKLDLGELFGNFVAHVATWDLPRIGHHFHAQEQSPFQGIEGWCTQSTGENCTIESLKVQVQLEAETGTNGQWVDGPADRQPGGYAHNKIKISNAPAGAIYKISLDFDVPEFLYPDTDFSIALKPSCRDDDRLFSSRIVVSPTGSSGLAQRTRPEYYKIPGRLTEDFIVQVPDSGSSDIFILAIPTPPFDLEDVQPFVQGFSLIWPYRYKVTRVQPQELVGNPEAAITLVDSEMLSLTPQAGSGFVYDCFFDRISAEAQAQREAAINQCVNECRSSGYGNSELDGSCNQQLSCRQACYLRLDGMDQGACTQACDRANNAGCSVTHNGRPFNMCGPCEGNAAGTSLVIQCIEGCSFFDTQ